MGIYVWGTGCGASKLIEDGLALERIEAFVDSTPCRDRFLGKPVLLPEMLPVEACELLIIASRHADAISHRCDELGIPAEKRLFLKNSLTVQDRNSGCTAAGEFLGEQLLRRLVPRICPVTVPAQLTDACLQEQWCNDYVRLGTLELLCRDLENIPGAAAELGVYRGAFASCINRLLPERKLYLFDSFEGFAPDAGASEAFQAAHRNTGPEAVLAAMPYSENVILKVGFFPESLRGLEERFCLVSLDADFEQVTLDGLRYFWPRLETGGYLLLHDWGNPELPGAARALARYEAQIGRKLPAVPLCDVGGTRVLVKI